MLTPEQEEELTGGGRCFLHTHELPLSHEVSEYLSTLESSRVVGNGTHSIPASIDYILVDTSGGSASLTLPDPVKKSKVTIIRVGGSNPVNISNPSGKVNGAASVSITSNYSPLTLKAIGADYYGV